MMVKKLKFDLHTGVAWVIWATLLTWAYHNHNPQLATYASWLTIGTGIYSGKRLFQKKKDFGGK